MNSKLFDDYSKNCNNLGMKEIMLALNLVTLARWSIYNNCKKMINFFTLFYTYSFNIKSDYSNLIFHNKMYG